MQIDRTSLPLAALASAMLAACGPSGGGSGSGSDSDSDSNDDTTQDSTFDLAQTVSLDGSWSLSSAVEDSTGQASVPAMASLGGGKAVAVWPHRAGFTITVRASVRDADGNWSATEQLENAQDTWVTYVAMDSNASGQAIAIWQQDDHAWAAHYDESTGWSSTTQIDNSSDSTSLYQLDVAMDADGNAMAVWRQDDSSGGSFSTYASYYDSTAGSWSNDQSLESQSLEASDPKAAFNSEGDALVFWEQADGTGHISLYYRWFHSDTGWASTQLFEQEEMTAKSVQLAFDSSDNAVVVWDQQLGTQSDIRMRRYINGTGWGSTRTVEDDPSGSSRPVLAVEPDGDATVAFEHLHDGSGHIGTARYQADTDTLESPVLIDTQDDGEVNNLTIAADATGDAYLAWQQEDAESNTHLWGQRYLADQSRWTVSTELESETETPATTPVAAAVDLDEGVVIWVEDSGPEALIKHSVFTEQ